MLTITNDSKYVKSYFTQPSRYSNSTIFEEIHLESVKKYRDAALWDILCLDDRIDLSDVDRYWEIIHSLMDLSLQSAIQLLQNRHQCQGRTLQFNGKTWKYPEIVRELHQAVYQDGQGVYRDLLASVVLIETIDLLQQKAESLTTQW